MWKCLKEITSYKTPSPSTVENQQQADNLNEFYCRFEKTKKFSSSTSMISTGAPQGGVLSPLLFSLYTSGSQFQSSRPPPPPPRSAHFVCYSYHFRRLFYSNSSALRSGHHTIFLHDSSSKRTYSIHSALKCAICEFKLYIFTDVYNVTLVCA